MKIPNVISVAPNIAMSGLGPITPSAKIITPNINIPRPHPAIFAALLFALLDSGRCYRSDCAGCAFLKVCPPLRAS